MDEYIRKCINFWGCFFNKELPESSLEGMVQFVKFGVIGVSNVIVSYVTNIIVLAILLPFHYKWDFVIGNIFAFLLSVLWSFFWNNKFVFKKGANEERSIIKTLLKTYITYAFTGIVLNNILGWVWINIFHISKFIAPIIHLIITVPINFLLNKIWAFRTKTVKQNK